MRVNASQKVRSHAGRVVRGPLGALRPEQRGRRASGDPPWALGTRLGARRCQRVPKCPSPLVLGGRGRDSEQTRGGGTSSRTARPRAGPCHLHPTGHHAASCSPLGRVLAQTPKNTGESRAPRAQTICKSLRRRTLGRVGLSDFEPSLELLLLQLAVAVDVEEFEMVAQTSCQPVVSRDPFCHADVLVLVLLQVAV